MKVERFFGGAKLFQGKSHYQFDRATRCAQSDPLARWVDHGPVRAARVVVRSGFFQRTTTHRMALWQVDQGKKTLKVREQKGGKCATC